MTDEASRAELAALAGEVSEQLSYLRELGVDLLASAGSFDDSNTATQELNNRALSPTGAPSRAETSRHAALTRNAEAGARIERTITAETPRTMPSSPPLSSPPLSSSSLPSPPPPSLIPVASHEVASAAPRVEESPKKTVPQIDHKEGAVEMPTRKPIRPPDAVPPPPQETLFGEITPQDELSLPREGETFEDIRADIGDCMRCPLCCEGRTKIVHSEGQAKARLMFVGEAPGADEDASGRPFVGRAGQLLNKIIEAIGMKREDVFIGNVNRCRPSQNRTPTIAEAATCKPFLLREIALLRPDIIVVMGNTAMKNLLDTKEGITKLRGTFMDYKGIKVMPTFHPAYLLRDPSKKRETWEDMKKVREYLQKTQSDK